MYNLSLAVSPAKQELLRSWETLYGQGVRFSLDLRNHSFVEVDSMLLPLFDSVLLSPVPHTYFITNSAPYEFLRSYAMSVSAFVSSLTDIELLVPLYDPNMKFKLCIVPTSTEVFFDSLAFSSKLAAKDITIGWDMSSNWDLSSECFLKVVKKYISTLFVSARSSKGELYSPISKSFVTDAIRIFGDSVSYVITYKDEYVDKYGLDIYYKFQSKLSKLEREKLEQELS